MQKNARVI